MTILQPLALGLLVLLPIIILLHMLRVRRQQLAISSTYFWRAAMREIREQPRLRRPPLTLLLLLQLLIAALIAFGLGRPAVQGVLAGGEFQASHTILLLDASASMQATDVAPNRFAVARVRAEGLLNGLDPAATATIIRMGVTPRILYSGDDLGLARAALGRAQPGAGAADVPEAMRLANSLVKPGIRNQIIIYSSLDFPPDAADLRPLGPIAATVKFEPIGGPAPNRAITVLSARALPGVANRYQLFARVSNFSGDAVTPVARLSADGITLEPRQLRLNPGAQVDLRWDLPPGASRVEVRLTGADDPLPLDDVAQLILPGQSSRRIALVSAQPDILKRALEAIPGTVVQVIPPKSYSADVQAAVTVFDNLLPDQLPAGGVLAIHPPAASAHLPSEGDSSDTKITRIQGNSRLLEAIDAANLAASVTINQAQRLKAPAWANEVIGANSGPLLLEGSLGSTPVVALTFNLVESNLPSRVSFPILMANIVNHLAPDALPTVVEPGRPVSLRTTAQTNTITFQRPSGSAERFSGGGGLVTFADTEEAGRYLVTETLAGSTTPRERAFTVNAGSDVESDLRSPRAPRVNDAPSGVVAGGPTRGREIWPLLALVALGILAIEWWVAHR